MRHGHADYCFSTTWRLAEPLEAVWRALGNPVEWPRWWPGCLIVETMSDRASPRVGGCYRFHWQGALPYCLVIRICIDRLEPQRWMTGRVDGPLVGDAVWRLREHGGETEVRFEFSVSAARPWMRYGAPLARPLFRWNHERLMARGEQGLRRWLAEAQTKPRQWRADYG